MAVEVFTKDQTRIDDVVVTIQRRVRSGRHRLIRCDGMGLFSADEVAEMEVEEVRAGPRLE